MLEGLYGLAGWGHSLALTSLQCTPREPLSSALRLGTGGSRRERKRELRSAMCSMNQLPPHSEVPNPAEEQGPETGSQLS